MKFFLFSSPAVKRVLGLLMIVVVGGLSWRILNRPVPVASLRVQSSGIVAETMGTGTLEARIRATVSSKIQGRLAEVLVDQNDRVTSGQLLAVLDDAELKEEVAVAQAALNATLATVERIRAEEIRAKAVLNQAKLTHARALDLMQADVAAQADLDKAFELMEVAEADLQRAQAAIVESERQRIMAQASLKFQETRLMDTRILSPFSGLIVKRDRDPGDVVVPGASILQLISTDELWVAAWLDETAMGGLAPGLPARVVFRSDPQQTYFGKVARLGRQTDRETREFIVEVLVETLPENWAVGQRAEVFIQTQSKASALSIPADFLVWKEGQMGVFEQVDGKAVWRRIETGLRGQGRVEITEGLEEGAWIVKTMAPTKLMLREGRKIKAL